MPVVVGWLAVVMAVVVGWLAVGNGGRCWLAVDVVTVFLSHQLQMICKLTAIDYLVKYLFCLW